MNRISNARIKFRYAAVLAASLIASPSALAAAAKSSASEMSALLALDSVASWVVPIAAATIDDALLPPDWRQRCSVVPDSVTARAVCDYIAGMTDRFAAQEYRRIFHVEFPL